MNTTQLQEFGRKYTSAWCSQNAASVAAFFAERGSLKINDGSPSVGRAAITAAAQGFMTAFPNMIVTMDSVGVEGTHVVYRWTLTGTNTGPGGAGRAVRISGHEVWTIDASGLIAESKGHFDETEYNRQLKMGFGAGAPRPSEPVVSIRVASSADWPRIWPLFKTVVSTGDTYTVLPEITEEEGRAYWMGRAVAVYVAEQAGQLVGTYCLRVNLPGLSSHIANAGYMVDPVFAGRGIGSQMCEHSMVEARAKGFEAMQFNAVVSTNHRAVALWKRHGFAIIGTVPRAYKHRGLGPVDLYVMHRFL